MKIPNKRELQQNALNYSSGIDFKDFIKFIKNIPQSHILFWLMIQLYHQTILQDLEKSFEMKYITNSDDWWSDYGWKTTIWY